MGSKLTSQNFAYRTQMTRNKRFLCFLFRENLLGINGFCSFVLRHPCPVHKINSFRISNRIENRRPALCLTLKSTAVFMYKAAKHRYIFYFRMVLGK